MAPPTRKIPCPLCQNPVQPRHLSPQGTCFYCYDGRSQSIQEHYAALFQEEQRRTERDNNKYASLKVFAASKIERELERAKLKELEAEKKAIQERYREEASIALAKRSLLHYTERYSPGYDASWAHESVAGHIEQFLRDVADKKSPRLIITLPSRFGKLCAHNTPVLTTTGYKKHGDLQTGDYVFGSNGHPTRIVACSEEQQANMYVTFTTGETIQCHENHEWVVYANRSKTWHTFETKQLLISRYGTPRKLQSMEKKAVKGRNLYQVPTPPRLETPNIELEFDPYVLGAWLGDGSTGKAVITHHRDELDVVNEVVRRGFPIRRTMYHEKAGSSQTFFYRDRNDPASIQCHIVNLGLLKEKFIPEIYFRAGTRQRLELLAGIIDTDGTLDRSGRYTISTISERLRDDYIRLIRSLGWNAYYHAEPPTISTSGVVGRNTVYCVGFQPTTADIPTVLARKKPHRVVSRQRVGIVDVGYLDNPVPGKCIQVEAEDGLYLVGATLIPTHNSLLASIIAPAWSMGNWPWMKFVLASYSDMLPTEFSRAIRDQLQSPEFRKVFPSGAHLSKDDASVKSWSTVEGGALRATGIGSGLLGVGADCLIIDDPIKDLEEADNPKTLEKVYDWFSSIAYSRLLPGGGCLLIQQRLSRLDLVGRIEQKMKEEFEKIEELRKDAEEIRNLPDPTFDQLRDAELLDEEADELEESMDRWTILEYPALATSNEYLNRETGEIIKSNNAKDPEGLVPLRKVGDALHPKRYNRSYLLKLKRANPRRFQAMFMGAPVTDEGNYFSGTDFKRYTAGDHPNLQHCHVFCAWDQALGTKQANDWTVGLAGAMDWEGNLWILDRIRGKFPDVRIVSDLVIDLHTKWGAQITGIEKTHISMAMGPFLKDRMRERQQYIVLAEGKEELKPITDKKMRARTLQGLCRSGKVYVPEGDDWDHFLTIMINFGDSPVDDDVDAAAWLAILATRQPPPRNPKQTQKTSKFSDIYDRLFKKAEQGPDNYMAS